MKAQWVRIGDVHTVVTGSTPSRGTDTYYGGDLPFVKPQDLDQGRRLMGAAESLSEAGKRRARVIPAGATLLSCIGTIGKSAYACVPVTTNQQINSLIPHVGIDPLFTYYYTRSPVFLRMLSDRAAKTTISIVNKRKLASLPYPLLPMEEQQAIVQWMEHSLNEWQRAKNLLEESAILLNQCRLAIVQRLYPSHLNEAPDGWRQVSLGELLKEHRIGLVRSLANQSDRYPYGYVKMNNITSTGELDMRNLARVEATEQEIADYRLRHGDFLINTRNSLELVGKSTVFTGATNPPVLFNNNLMRIRFQEGVESRYIQGFMQSIPGQTQLQRMKSATTNVAAIYSKHLFRMRILLPPTLVQRQIIADWDDLTDLQQKGLRSIPSASELDELEKAIFTQAFESYYS